MNREKYAGDITLTDAWSDLGRDERAVLIDVRSDAEWEYVGIPCLKTLNKEPIFVAWANYPSNVPNNNFVDDVKTAVPETDQKILCLCRSGQRSIKAAIALTAAGYTNVFNILEGFEGDKNESGQRGFLGGWRMRGLPWRHR